MATTEEVKTIIKTCDAFPVQYEGRLKSGKTFYFRYRHDAVTISVSKSTTKSIMQAVKGETIYRAENVTGDKHSGCMSDEQAISHMKKVFTISNKVIIQPTA